MPHFKSIGKNSDDDFLEFKEVSKDEKDYSFEIIKIIKKQRKKLISTLEKKLLLDI